MVPVALALVVLILACAVAPVAINMAGLHLRAQVVELGAQAQGLRAEMRDLEAQMARLSSAPVLQQQVEKMGLLSAQSVSYLAADDGDADGGSGSHAATADGGSGVAWVPGDSEASGEGTRAADAR